MGGCCQRLYYTIVRKKSSYKKESESAHEGGGTQGSVKSREEDEDWGGWDDDVEMAATTPRVPASESAPFIPAPTQQPASPAANSPGMNRPLYPPRCGPRAGSGGKVRKSKAGWIVRDKSAKAKRTSPQLVTGGSLYLKQSNPFQTMGMEASGYSGDRKIQVKNKTSAVLKAGSQSTLRSEGYFMDDDAGENGWNLEEDDDDI